MVKYSLGIDISAKSFHVCLSAIDQQQQVKVKASSTFQNKEEGFAQLERWIEKHRQQKELPLSIVVEATGVYYERCALYLHQKGYGVSVVLPNMAKKYLGSIGQKTKNDTIDARGLSRMGAERCLEVWQPMDDFFYTLRSYTRQHERLQQTKTILNNQLHAEEHQAHPNDLVGEQLRQLIASIEEQLKALATAMKQHVHSNAEVAGKVKGILKIKGVGLLTAATVLAETNGFALFKNIPQLVSYAGYDVVEDQSGARVGKTKISKRGNGHIRRALHMPALHAAHWEGSSFAALYERVFAKSGIKMKALVGVQKKLLSTIYALWKKGQAYDKGYKNQQNQGNKHTEEPEQVLPSLVSAAGAENSYGKKVVPHQAELHKVNIPMEPSQYAPSLVEQM
jgi:transposase